MREGCTDYASSVHLQAMSSLERVLTTSCLSSLTIFLHQRRPLCVNHAVCYEACQQIPDQ